VDKIEIYNLAREVCLPKFDIPEEFSLKILLMEEFVEKMHICDILLTKEQIEDILKLQK
jgi:hypothetical protein